ncbi:MAG TPA: S8 family serine peptidase [Gemmatimonadaceae bacterium]|nr:S8 family serine peptidase [Gemmatimonadaceae bacterium]
MKRSLVHLALACGVLVAACSDTPTSIPAPGANLARSGAAGGSYIIIGTGNALPADLAARVAAAGGTITASMPGIGVAVATSSNAGFAGTVRGSGVMAVVPDVMLQWSDPSMRTVEAEAIDEQIGATALGGSDETFYDIQWAPRAVHAPEAWEMGASGRGVRVAILDGGIHSTHVDLAANLDVARSRSFVPGQPFNADVGTFWHGTHVAGIVAAGDNGIGTIGIAPSATLVGVKVLHNGSGAFSWIINGIYYAATPIEEGGAGADIINMSLGAALLKSGWTEEDGTKVGAQEVAALTNAISRATTYAYQRGTTVIAALGNDGVDMDHTADLIFVPAMSSHVIAVSATGPYDFGHGAKNWDRPASYTNFGQSAVAFAAPGGDFALPGNEVCAYQRLNPPVTSLQYCWALDMVISTSRGTSNTGYSWAAGTSMASPAAAAVAALVIERFGRIGPAQVEAKLRASADDLGKPGNDDFYGAGRVNALRAIP